MAHKLGERERTEDVQLKSDKASDFPALLISPPVLEGLKNAGFVRPSPIQVEAIPIGRCGADLIVQAKSGTGKTCVFAVVALESVKTDCKAVQVLVLAPTREIVVQVYDVVSSLGSSIPKLKCGFFIGGTPLSEDKPKAKNCQIAVGTPGRIKQLIRETVLKTDAIRLFVLDEADKLLEEAFRNDINWIYHKLPCSKQMLALSATYPEILAQLLAKYMQAPTFIQLSGKNPALIGIEQFYEITAYHPLQSKAFENKIPHVLRVLSTFTFGQCIIFSNYRMRVQSLCDRLNAQGWPAIHICGEKAQSERLLAMIHLRDFKCRVLVSTDLTARGIDVENVDLIISLDVPWDLETYLHRIGRAGRFGSRGFAVTLASGGEEEKLLEDMKKNGNLSMTRLPELGLLPWKTTGRSDATEARNTVESSTPPTRLGVRHTTKCPSDDESDALPVCAGAIQNLVKDLNLRLEKEGISRRKERAAFLHDATASVHSNISAKKLMQPKKLASNKENVLVRYDTVNEDANDLQQFANEWERDRTCNVCDSRASDRNRTASKRRSMARECHQTSTLDDEAVEKIHIGHCTRLGEKLREHKEEWKDGISGVIELLLSPLSSYDERKSLSIKDVERGTELSDVERGTEFSDVERGTEFSDAESGQMQDFVAPGSTEIGDALGPPVSSNGEQLTPMLNVNRQNVCWKEWLGYVQARKYSLWFSEYTKNMRVYR